MPFANPHVLVSTKIIRLCASNIADEYKNRNERQGNDDVDEGEWIAQTVMLLAPQAKDFVSGYFGNVRPRHKSVNIGKNTFSQIVKQSVDLMSALSGKEQNIILTGPSPCGEIKKSSKYHRKEKRLSQFLLEPTNIVFRVQRNPVTMLYFVR